MSKKNRREFARKTLSEYARKMYRQHGRGVVLYAGVSGMGVGYATEEVAKLSRGDRALAAKYNPEAEFVFSCPVIPGDVNGIWKTYVCTMNSREASFRVEIPRGKSHE